MKKKIFFLLIFVVLLLLLLSLDSSASFIVNSNDTTYVLPDLPPEIIKDSHFMITQSQDKKTFRLYFTNDSDFGQLVYPRLWF